MGWGLPVQHDRRWLAGAAGAAWLLSGLLVFHPTFREWSQVWLDRAEGAGPVSGAKDRRAQGFADGGRGACWGDADRLGGVSTRQEATGEDCFGQSMGAKWEQCGSTVRCVVEPALLGRLVCEVWACWSLQFSGFPDVAEVVRKSRLLMRPLKAQLRSRMSVARLETAPRCATPTAMSPTPLT
jgi:hypothetical protein